MLSITVTVKIDNKNTKTDIAVEATELINLIEYIRQTAATTDKINH